MFKLYKKHQKYQKYNPTNIDWIGDIPDGWEARKLKHISRSSFQYGANEAALDDNLNNPRFVRITDIDDKGNLRPETFKSLEEAIARDFILRDGDILFARSGATVGKTFQYRPDWGRCCYAGYLIRMTVDEKKAKSDFIYYITKSSLYEGWKDSIFIKATIQNISAEKYKSFFVAIPSLEEQQKITDYLDEKTAVLDEAIAQKKKQIELLAEHRTALINNAITKGLDPNIEMKDSGIEWIGKIPKGWEVKKMKYLARIKTGDGDTQDNVDNGEYPFFVRSDTIERINRYSIDGEAILTAGDGVGVGKVFHYYIGKFAYHQRVYAMTSFREVYGKYLFYYIKDNFHKEVLKLSARSTVDSLRLPMLLSFPVCFPSFKEQGQIVDYLDKETKYIDDMIAKIEKSIELLEEYKTSLISHVVSGKIRVS